MRSLGHDFVARMSLSRVLWVWLSRRAAPQKEDGQLRDGGDGGEAGRWCRSDVVAARVRASAAAAKRGSLGRNN